MLLGVKKEELRLWQTVLIPQMLSLGRWNGSFCAEGENRGAKVDFIRRQILAERREEFSKG